MIWTISDAHTEYGAPLVAEIKQTCGACPSQWECKLEDGRFMYVRYRFGHLSIGIGDTMFYAVRNALQHRGAELNNIDEYDGVKTWDEIEPYVAAFLVASRFT